MAMDEPPGDPPIEEWLRRAQAGDTPARAVFLRKLRRQLERSLRRRALPPQFERDDALQQLMIKLDRSLPQLPAAPLPLRAYLRSAVHNVLAQAARRARAAKHGVLRTAPLLTEPGPRSGTSGLETRLDRKQRHQEVYATLLRLPERWRQILLLRFEEDLTPSEVARRLQLTTAQVYGHERRAIERLRSALTSLVAARPSLAARALKGALRQVLKEDP